MEFQKVILAAIGYVWHFKSQLLKTLWLPLTLCMLLDATASLDKHIIAGILITILQIMLQAIIAIATHRMILLGPEYTLKLKTFKWTKRESFFVLYMVGLYLIMLPLSAFSVLVPIVGTVVALILWCWVIGRFCLVFPAIAIDQGVTFKLSWKLTENHQLLMFLIVVIFPLIIGIFAVPLAFVPYSFLISSIYISIATILTVAALSVTYKIIYDENYGS